MKREHIGTILSAVPAWIGAAGGAALLSPFGATLLAAPDRDATAVVTLTAALFCRMAQDALFAAED